MRQMIYLLVPFFSLVSTSAFAEAPKVITSIKPVQSLVAAVMEGVGQPEVLITGASSPHSYAMTPKNASDLQAANVVFWIGPELETFLQKPIETLGGDAKSVALIDVEGLQVYDVREGVDFHHDHHDHHDDHKHGHEKHAHKDDHGHKHDDQKHGHDKHAQKDDHGHKHDDHKHGHKDDHGHKEKHAHKQDDHGHKDHHDHAHEGRDAHIWLDPQNGVVMVRAIAATLSEVDAANKATYAANAAAVIAKIETVSAEIAQDLAPISKTPYIVFHDGYQYFEERFDLSPAGAVAINPEVVPGAKRIAELQERVKADNIACLFAEPQFDEKIISVIGEKATVRTGVLDPLGANIEGNSEGYLKLLRAMGDSVRTCLAP